MMSKPVSDASDVSVIIAVYNHFKWLQLILDALRMQSVKGFEVIIADDGSNEETVAQIKQYIKDYPELPITHSWQEDKGWRKNRSLNKAVRRSKGEYLIFMDGDCIPHPRFVEDHIRLRRRGAFFGGRRVDLTPSFNKIVEGWETLPKDYFSRARRGVFKYFGERPFFDSLKQVRHSIRMPFIFGRPVGVKNIGFWGCNMSMYKDDLVRLNGFDERYVNPGTGEDTDLEVRVRNAGMECRMTARHALELHRNHQRLPLDSPDNKALLDEAKQTGRTVAIHGLKENHPDD